MNTTREWVLQQSNAKIQAVWDAAFLDGSRYSDGVIDTLDWLFGSGPKPESGGDSE